MGILAGHVFVSYVREDSARVDRLQALLEAAGIRVWRDISDLGPGQDWRIEIDRAITKGALVFLACFSDHSEARETTYQREELVLAAEQVRRRTPGKVWLIPVRFTDCSLPPYDLGPGRTLDSLNRVDLFDGPWPAADRLVSAITALLPPPGPRVRGPVFLPYRAEDVFVGRDTELNQLDQALTLTDHGGAVVVQQTVGAVHGLGGIGKSTLAAYWAHRHLAEHTATWWITADTPANLQQGLADLALALDPERAGQPLEVLAEQATAWLASHDQWLLVLDNVTQPAHLDTLLARIRGGSGQVLITSRIGAGWHRITAHTVRLDVLPHPQAVDLLTRITQAVRPQAEMDGAAELCTELGCLPLAIEQAAGFLAETGRTPTQYLDRLRGYPAETYAQPPTGTPIDRTVARIWHTTLDHLTTDTALAAQVLHVLAWYAPDHIPRTLLDHPDLGTPPGIDTAIGRLTAHNMITLTPDGTAIAVHRLVQAVARTPDPHDPHRHQEDIDHARTLATTLLDNATPDGWEHPDHWPAWRTLLPHITALTDHAPPTTDTHTTADLLNETGMFLLGQRASTRAITVLHRAHTTHQTTHGPDHPDTLAACSNLANAYTQAGDTARAIPLLEQTLTDRKRVLGTDHPNTLASRNSLAYAYEAAGDTDRALPLYEQTLADRERVLSTDDPATLTSRSNLANAYTEAGNTARAIPLLEQTLADRKRILGTDHPNTLVSRNSLAYAYKAAGDLDRALPLYEQTLADSERILGTDHPHTLTFRNNLAGAYETVGDLDRALPLYEATLPDRERILGTDHPHTLTSRNNLAHAYRAAGDTDRALTLYEQTLADCERALGTDHPTTQIVRANLAAASERPAPSGGSE